MPEPAPLLPQPHHRLSLRGQFGSLCLDISVDLCAPWTVLFGPSGSGKSTALRALCGLLPHSRGSRLTFERRKGDTWVDLSTRPPNHRALAWAPQDAAIFPHLTAGANIRFPTRVCTENAADASLVEEAVTLFRLHTLAPRRPQALSGGERQRVALARAFATPHACLMLLDEPFSGLDRKLRDQLLPGMQDWLRRRNIPCLSVTHDVDEALLLNAEVIRLDAGRVLAQGPAAEVLAPDRDRLLRALGGAKSA